MRAADPSSEIPLKRNYPVNESLNPCENLYEYACSKTIESFKLRPDRRKHTFAFNDSMERILEFKKKKLKELTSAPAENKMAEQLKNYYLSCVNKEARAKEESDYISKKITVTTKYLMINYEVYIKIKLIFFRLCYSLRRRKLQNKIML